jgi:hypothetical protein
MTARSHMEELARIGFKIKSWTGPSDTRHNAIATEVMLQTYFMSDQLTGSYIQPPDNVTATYIAAEKSFVVSVPEHLLEAFLDKYESDLTAPGESKKLYCLTCAKGTVTYSLSPYEPTDTARGTKRKVDEDLWGFLRGEKGRVYRIEDITAATQEHFRKAGIDASEMKVLPQRNKRNGGITCVDASFTVNGLAPVDPYGLYPYDYWPTHLTNMSVGSGFMSFEPSRTLAKRLNICEQCLRDTNHCSGHGKGVKRATTTETPQELRARTIKYSMDAIKRFNARNKAPAGSSSSMEQ